MVQTTTLVLFLIVAAIHLTPATGAFSGEQLEALYGLPVEDPSLEILLRHRAVLFGIVGVLLAAAAFRPGVRPVAYAVGFASMLSYLLLVAVVGDANDPVMRVAWVDVVAALLLAASLAIEKVLTP